MVPATPTRRFRPRFRLRTFLIVVTIFCVWLGWHIHGTRRQREAVRVIGSYGGYCSYDFVGEPERVSSPDDSWAPRYVRELLGVDFFHAVVAVDYSPDLDLSEKPFFTGFDREPFPLARLADLPKLRQLWFFEWHVTDEDLAQIGALEQLRTLHVSEADAVTDAGVVELGRLRHLQMVYLGDSKITELECHISDKSLEVFSQMQELESLHIRGTFTDKGVSYLSLLKNLRALTLAHWDSDHQNEITDQSLAFLLELPDFERLDLSQTKVTPEFVEQVKTTFPECDVSW